MKKTEFASRLEELDDDTLFKSAEWLSFLSRADEEEFDELRKEALKSFTPRNANRFRFSFTSGTATSQELGIDSPRSSLVTDYSYSSSFLNSLPRNTQSFTDTITAGDKYAEALANLLVPSQDTGLSWWEKVERFCDRLFHNFYYQTFQIIIALVSCGYYIYETYDYYDDLKWGVSSETYIKDVTVSVIFSIDYAIGFIGAQNKWRHICRWASLFDFLSILPGILLLISEKPFLEFFILMRLVRASYILRLHRFSNVAELSRKSISVMQSHDYFAMTADEQALNFTRHALSLILTVVCIVFIATGFVFYLQVQSHEEDFEDVKAAHDDHLYFHEALYFVIITLATVGFGDITPVTATARVAMAAFVVLFLTFVPYFSVELVGSMHEYSHYLGRYWVNKKTKHIVLTGSITFENVDSFLSELHRLKEFKNMKIVILGPQEPDFKLLAVIRSSRFKSSVVYLKGSPLNLSDLKRAAAHKASAIILLTKRVIKKPKQEDIKLIYQVMSVVSYVGPPDAHPGLSVVVGVTRPQYMPQIQALGVRLVVSRDLIKLACVSNSVLHPGMSALVCNLIKSPELSAPALLNAAWYAEYYRGVSKQIFLVQLSRTFVNAKFPDVVAKVYQMFGHVIIGVENAVTKKAILNPGPRYKIIEGDKAFVITFTDKDAQDITFCRSIKEEHKMTKHLRFRPGLNQIMQTSLNQEQKQLLQRSMQSMYGSVEKSKSFQKEYHGQVLQVCRLSKSGQNTYSTLQHCAQQLSLSLPNKRENAFKGESSFENKEEKVTIHSDELEQLQNTDLDDLSGTELKELLTQIKSERLKNGPLQTSNRTEEVLMNLVSLDIMQMTPSIARAKALELQASLKESSILNEYLVNGSEFHLSSTNWLHDHVVVVGIPFAPTHIEYFLQPLVGRIKVVFLVRHKEQELMEGCLMEVKHNNQIPLDGVYYVVGSPISRRRLLQAGVDQCSSLILLNSRNSSSTMESAKSRSTEEAQQQVEANSEPNDADILLAYLKIKPLVKQDCHVMVELVNDASMRYLHSCDDLYAEPFSGMGDAPNPWPLFGAGKVYATSYLSMLLAKAVFNPSIVIILEALLGIDGNPEMMKPKNRQLQKSELPPTTPKRKIVSTSKKQYSTQRSGIASISVPPEFINHSFGELFQELICPPLNIVAIGLYRARGTKEATEPYVYTAPRADTVLLENDKVFVLTNPTSKTKN